MNKTIYTTELVLGKVLPETRDGLLDIVKQMRHSKNIDGLTLGGTELSLILSDGMLREVSFLDTTSIHVNAAVTHMAAESPIIR
jgi:aspartate racemase